MAELLLLRDEEDRMTMLPSHRSVFRSSRRRRSVGVCVFVVVMLVMYSVLCCVMGNCDGNWEIVMYEDVRLIT